MTAELAGPRGVKRSSVLLILTSIYGLLYAAFIIAGAHGMAGYEPLVVRLLFVLFLIGYAALWWNEGLGGAIFVVWWGGMWYLGFFVVEHDRGAGVVMGVPLFVLGALFTVHWYKNRPVSIMAS